MELQYTPSTCYT